MECVLLNTVPLHSAISTLGGTLNCLLGISWSKPYQTIEQCKGKCRLIRYRAYSCIVCVSCTSYTYMCVATKIIVMLCSFIPLPRQFVTQKIMTGLASSEKQHHSDYRYWIKIIFGSTIYTFTCIAAALQSVSYIKGAMAWPPCMHLK